VLHDATGDDLPSILALLSQSGLPTADLDEARLRDFIVALDAGDVIGVVGLERHGEQALLRSLAVAPGWRGQGLGRALVEAVEARVAGLGVRSLTLLTQTAAPFFAARDYVPIPRAQAPAAVQASAEFTSLCPASSTCMTKAFAALP
jgi:amino-acid N-acetyltransferase